MCVCCPSVHAGCWPQMMSLAQSCAVSATRIPLGLCVPGPLSSCPFHSLALPNVPALIPSSRIAWVSIYTLYRHLFLSLCYTCFFGELSFDYKMGRSENTKTSFLPSAGTNSCPLTRTSFPDSPGAHQVNVFHMPQHPSLS